MDYEKKTQRKPNPRASSNFLSSLFLLYLVPVFYRSYKKGFIESDLFETLKEDESNSLGDKLEETWKSYNKRHKKWTLHLALLNNFGCVFFFTGFLLFLKEVVEIIFVPFLIGKLVSYFAQTTEVITPEDAYCYAAGLIACLTMERIVAHPVMLWNQHLAMKMRVACCGLIYRKILRLSKSALAQTTVGHIINLMSNDLSRFDTGFNLIHYMWISPIQATLAIVILYLKIGSACFLGVGFLVLLLPIQLLVGKKTATFRLRTALRTDERVRLMNEIISGMQVIKMYTWEIPFAKLIAHVRSKEMQSIRRLKIMWSLSDFELYATRTAIFVSLVCYYLMRKPITAEIVFSLAAIFEVANHTISSLFEMAVRSAAETNVALQRINNFLNNNELSSKMIEPPTVVENTMSISNGNIKRSPRILLQNVNAKWNSDASEYSLSNISFSINRPQLFAVIGPVGSGKSSLFNVLLHELPISNGQMDIKGTVSYSSQEAWLFSASVRHNILFGDIYDQKRYRKVCKVCALESDFAQLPHGDKTLVGERGKALSGGQKARINLARAVYKKADIYLLDDPLSAVDTNVGRKLFNECIRDFLQDKICILITHQLQYLKDADKLLILKDGGSEGLGTYEELQQSGLDFAMLLGEMQTQETDEEKKAPCHRFY